MTTQEAGHTGVTVFAGPLTPSASSPDRILFMGATLTISIDPDTARQWIEVLNTITSTKESA